MAVITINNFKAILLPPAPILVTTPRTDIVEMKAYAEANTLGANAVTLQARYDNQVVPAINAINGLGNRAVIDQWITATMADILPQLEVAPNALNIITLPEFSLNGGLAGQNHDLVYDGRFPLSEDLDTYLQTQLLLQLRLRPERILFAYPCAYYSQTKPEPGAKWQYTNRMTILTSHPGYAPRFVKKLTVNQVVDKVDNVLFAPVLGVMAQARVEILHWAGQTGQVLAFGFALCDDIAEIDLYQINMIILSGSGAPFCRIGRRDVRHHFIMNDHYSWNPYAAILPRKSKSVLWAAGYYKFYTQAELFNAPPLVPSVADVFLGTPESTGPPMLQVGVVGLPIKVNSEEMKRCYWQPNIIAPVPADPGPPPIAAVTGVTGLFPMPERK